MSGERVLVTGGSGFVGAHCIIQLLDAGYRVRTTVRELSRAEQVRALVTAGGASGADTIEFVAVDLTSDDGWAGAMADCTFVLHVASPFPAGTPKHEDELIVPARDGALRVLRAARDAGVKRVVLTSSFAAIGAYVKSKTIAERAAWDFIAREGGALELSVINPVGVFGPALGPDTSTSIQLVKSMLDGKMPGAPQLSFGVVDVRDVASLHLRAMVEPAAAGQRFLAVAGESMSMFEMANALRAQLGTAAKRAPTRVLPNWLVRTVALFSRQAAVLTPELGKVKRLSNEKARRVLGWAPRSNAEAIAATGESLVRLGMLVSG